MQTFIPEKVVKAHKIGLALALVNDARKSYYWNRVSRAEMALEIIDAGFCTPEDIGTKYKELNRMALRKWWRPMRIVYRLAAGKKPE